MNQIEYSKRAIQDLERVMAEVFESSKDYTITQNYIEELLDKVEAKGEFPKSGAPLYYNDLFTGYYFIVYKAYIAFYRVDKEVMYVDRILFGQSDYIHQLKIFKEPTK